MAKLKWTPSYFTIFNYIIINKSFFTLLSIKRQTKSSKKIVHNIPIQNCLQFDTITMNLDKRVKSQGSVKRNMIL